MPLSDFLFSKTHNVDQLVDIKSRKRVDKVLLKVIKTVRERGSITEWIKPTSDLRTEFEMTDRQIKSVCSALNEYYDLQMNPEEMKTPNDMVLFIKSNKQAKADSIYLIDGFSVDTDANDDLTEEPKENLEVKKEILEESEPSDPVKEDVKGEPSTEKDKPAVPIDAVGKEGLLDAVVGGAAAAGLVYAAIKLYQEHNWYKLTEHMNKHYAEIVKDIKENHKNEDAFAKNRAVLYKASDLKAAFKVRYEQLMKINKMPLPHEDEPVDLYKNKLSAYLHPKMDVRTNPGDPSYLTLEEAGYFNASNVLPLIEQIRVTFNLQDTVDGILFPYLKKTDRQEYAPVMKELGIANFYHSLYQEAWTDHFGTHVLKAIHNGLEGKLNKDVGSSEQYSMESLASEPKQENMEWSEMLNSL